METQTVDGDAVSGGEPSSLSTSERCNNCGEFSVNKDTQGSQDVMVSSATWAIVCYKFSSMSVFILNRCVVNVDIVLRLSSAVRVRSGVHHQEINIRKPSLFALSLIHI